VASASRATPVRAIIGHPAGSGCALRVDDHAFTGRQGPLGFLEDQRRIRFAAAHRQLAEDPQERADELHVERRGLDQEHRVAPCTNNDIAGQSA